LYCFSIAVLLERPQSKVHSSFDEFATDSASYLSVLAIRTKEGERLSFVRFEIKTQLSF